MMSDKPAEVVRSASGYFVRLEVPFEDTFTTKEDAQKVADRINVALATLLRMSKVGVDKERRKAS